MVDGTGRTLENKQSLQYSSAFLVPTIGLSVNCVKTTHTGHIISKLDRQVSVVDENKHRNLPTWRPMGELEIRFKVFRRFTCCKRGRKGSIGFSSRWYTTIDSIVGTFALLDRSGDSAAKNSCYLWEKKLAKK